MLNTLKTKITKPLIAAAFVAGTALATSPAYATEVVYSPYVTKGKVQAEYKFSHSLDESSSTDGKQKHKAGVSYGVTDYWKTGLEFQFERSGTAGADLLTESVNWKNTFQLSSPGEYFVDFGAYSELVYDTTGSYDKLKVLLLMAKDTGDFSHVANVGFEQEFGEDSDNDAEALFSWSTSYNHSKEFKPGFEVFSEFGSINDTNSFQEEKHQFGPVVYGKVGPFKYDVGYLLGVSDAATDEQFKVNLKYVF